MSALDSTINEHFAGLAVRKDLTTTPLQALTMMNNITFVEAGRMIADRVIREGGSTAPQRLDHLFRLILSRKPTPAENKALIANYNDIKAEFQANPKGAESLLEIGSSPRDSSLPVTEVAAWTMVANTILNLDEAITTN